MCRTRPASWTTMGSPPVFPCSSRTLLRIRNFALWLRRANSAGPIFFEPRPIACSTIPKARRFIDAFTDYWLDLRKIDDSSPSTTLYNDYELDDPLKLAAVEETRLFVQEMFNRNLPARTVVEFRLHVPQRAAGEALRHSRRHRSGDAQGHAARKTPSAAAS